MKKRVFSILNKNMHVRKILTAESHFSGVITSEPSKNSSTPIEMFLATVGQTLYRDFWATLYVVCLYCPRNYLYYDNILSQPSCTYSIPVLCPKLSVLSQYSAPTELYLQYPCIVPETICTIPIFCPNRAVPTVSQYSAIHGANHCKILHRVRKCAERRMHGYGMETLYIRGRSVDTPNHP